MWKRCRQSLLSIVCCPMRTCFGCVISIVVFVAILGCEDVTPQDPSDGGGTPTASASCSNVRLEDTAQLTVHPHSLDSGKYADGGAAEIPIPLPIEIEHGFFHSLDWREMVVRFSLRGNEGVRGGVSGDIEMHWLHRYEDGTEEARIYSLADLGDRDFSYCRPSFERCEAYIATHNTGASILNREDLLFRTWFKAVIMYATDNLGQARLDSNLDSIPRYCHGEDVMSVLSTSVRSTVYAGPVITKLPFGRSDFLQKRSAIDWDNIPENSVNIWRFNSANGLDTAGTVRVEHGTYAVDCSFLQNSDGEPYHSFSPSRSPGKIFTSEGGTGFGCWATRPPFP